MRMPPPTFGGTTGCWTIHFQRSALTWGLRVSCFVCPPTPDVYVWVPGETTVPPPPVGVLPWSTGLYVCVGPSSQATSASEENTVSAVINLRVMDTPELKKAA